MQKMFDAGCDPEMYQAQGKGHNFPDMTGELCPQCRGEYLKKHGFYSRQLVTIEFEGIIIIRRYYCHACGKTVSLLPSFCHPKRTYGILVIIRLLVEFYIKMGTVCQIAANFLAATGVECTRQLLLHYRKRIEKNLNSLAMAITEIYSMGSPPVTEKSDTRKKVGQLLSNILKPQETSLKIFELTRATYLTKQAS